MPIFEYCCKNEACEDYAHAHEHYVATSDKPDPNCDSCGLPTGRMISTFGVVFTGPITKRYNDPNADNAHMESHWVWETKGPGGEKIKPRPLLIEDFQQQREYAKREGLVNPKDVGPMEVGSDGKSFSSRGMPGCW